MATLPETGAAGANPRWSYAVAALAAYQWKLFEMQYQAGLRIMQTVLGVPPAPPPPTPGAVIAQEVRRLEEMAAERVRQGLAPPREIYHAPYRERIDWSRFPEWVRPSDPEMFQGCAHEG
jgi:hypothetical protein